MQKDLIRQQVELINQLLVNHVIQNNYIIDGFTHLLRFSSHQFISICQKAPHIGVCLIQDEPECDYLETMPHATDLSLTKGVFKGLIFDEVGRTLYLEVDHKRVLFDMRSHGKKEVMLEGPLAFTKSVPIKDEDHLSLQTYKKDLLGYIFKNVRAYFFKIQKQIALFKQELEELPSIVEKQEEAIVFILEHRQDIESKNNQFLDFFKKYDINYLLPYGTIIKKAYKKMHKLETQKQVLPKLILSCEAKLTAPYIAPKIQTASEKKEKKESRVFYTSHKEKIRVARSDKDADSLTFKQAHGNYYWFHVDHYPGAHTVIFSSTPTPEAIDTARFLAKYYSKAKDKPECDVIQTQVKFLKKGKKPGEVYVLKKQVMLVKHDLVLEKKLFFSSI